ncbi:hypothetical protein [Campylobacter iguaniorum]|uniref:hypothetical protein n=1 Tax=Campylobacter iguaniorum TaxID=1244531 RepID=UPI000B1A3D50|nr:hypothetical protein [Campylobacter iguaniorum]
MFEYFKKMSYGYTIVLICIISIIFVIISKLSMDFNKPFQATSDYIYINTVDTKTHYCIAKFKAEDIKDFLEDKTDSCIGLKEAEFAYFLKRARMKGGKIHHKELVNILKDCKRATVRVASLD